MEIPVPKFPCHPVGILMHQEISGNAAEDFAGWEQPVRKSNCRITPTSPKIRMVQIGIAIGAIGQTEVNVLPLWFLKMPT